MHQHLPIGGAESDRHNIARIAAGLMRAAFLAVLLWSGPFSSPLLAQSGAFSTWTVQGNDMLQDGRIANMYGINWFGMETRDRAPHGLWTGRTPDDFLNQVVGFGFTTIRFPVSPEVINPGYRVSNWAKPYGSDGREVLEYMLAAAERAGLAVLIDIHNFNSKDNLPGQPYGRGYTIDDWIRDLTTLAELGNVYPSLMGLDLFNEPYNLTWTEWEALASQAGQAVLAANPRLLIFVEGVGNESDNGGYAAFWGENMVEATGSIPGIPADKLVQAAHVYGPSVYVQDYFNDPTFPDNMPGIWDIHFGHLALSGFAYAPTEFGGEYEGEDKIWQDAFVDYLIARHAAGFYYWALNPNSGDTGGILQDDWITPVQPKIDLLHRLMAGIATAGKNAGVYDPSGELPAGYTLEAAYPNPFNPATTIRFGLPESGHVVLVVYDGLGREVARPIDGVKGAGYHDVLFEADGLPSGVYFYRIMARGDERTFAETGSVMLAK